MDEESDYESVAPWDLLARIITGRGDAEEARPAGELTGSQGPDSLAR